MTPFKSPAVAAAFSNYPPAIKQKLLALRELIFETAVATEGVGEIEETLKWSEPAYLTPQTKSGTTIRIDWKSTSPNEYAMLFHCQTTLIADFRQRYPDDFEFDGNRRIVFAKDTEIPVEPLKHCIAAALTYHLAKKTRR